MKPHLAMITTACDHDLHRACTDAACDCGCHVLARIGVAPEFRR